MKKTILALTVAAFTALTVGCNKENIIYSGGNGALALKSLSAEGNFVEVDPVTKSVETADVNEFAIAIVDVASGRTVYSWDRYADMPEAVSQGRGRLQRKTARGMEPTRVLRLSECDCNGRQYGPGFCRLHYRQYESDGTLYRCIPC